MEGPRPDKFAFVALCGALQTHFHGKGRNGNGMLLLSAYRRRAATINRRNTKNPFALRGKPLFPYYSCPSAKGQQTTRPSRRSTACRTSGARMPYTICTSQPFCTTPLQGRAFRACSLTKAGSFTVTRRRVKQLSTVRMFSRPPKAAMSFSTPCSSSGRAFSGRDGSSGRRPGVGRSSALMSTVNTTKYTAIWARPSRYSTG